MLHVFLSYTYMHAQYMRVVLAIRFELLEKYKRIQWFQFINLYALYIFQRFSIVVEI